MNIHLTDKLPGGDPLHSPASFCTRFRIESFDGSATGVVSRVKEPKVRTCRMGGLLTGSREVQGKLVGIGPLLVVSFLQSVKGVRTQNIEEE